VPDEPPLEEIYLTLVRRQDAEGISPKRAEAKG
jgi:hypothetical protein